MRENVKRSGIIQKQVNNEHHDTFSLLTTCADALKGTWEIQIQTLFNQGFFGILIELQVGKSKKQFFTP